MMRECTIKFVTDREVPFFWSVFNDGHDQFIVVAVLLPRLSSTDALDHLLVGDLELLTRVEKSGHYSSLGVSVNDSTSTCMVYMCIAREGCECGSEWERDL